MKEVKKTNNLKKYQREYYQKNRDKILEKYFNTKKKTPKCKMCGKILPKEIQGNTKYCDECLYGKGHGEDAHRMAAARYERKKKKALDKQKGKRYHKMERK